MTQDVTIAQAAERLLAARRLVVTTHAKPDGDAYGSVVALAAALRRTGRHVRAVLAPPVPQAFERLAGYETVELFREGVEFSDGDLLVIVDTRAWSQVQPMRRAIEPHLHRALVLDHHLNGDIAAAWQHIDAQAAACCEIVAAVIEQLEARRQPSDDADALFSSVVAEALFVGIASDTGWFRFSNTTPRTHTIAAKLLALGVDQADVFRRIEQAERPQKLALLRRALDSLELVADGRIALMHLRASDFAETGARAEETERFIDVPQMVASVQAVVLAVEALPDDPNGAGSSKAGAGVRLSFRSKPGPAAMNVADLAARFGGGGHARAAGAKFIGPLDAVLDQVRKALVAAV